MPSTYCVPSWCTICLRSLSVLVIVADSLTTWLQRIPSAFYCYSYNMMLLIDILWPPQVGGIMFSPVPLSVPCQHRPALRVGKSTAGPTWTCNIADKYIQGEWVRYTHAHCTLYFYLYLYDDGLSYKCPFQSLWSLSKTNWRMVHPQHVENIVPSVDDALTEEVFPNV